MLQVKDKSTIVLEDGETLYIEGELEQWLIATVPTSTSMSMCEIIRGKLMEATNRPVLILTDNIDLLEAQRISPKKTFKLIKDYEETRGEQRDVSQEIEGE